MGSGSSSIIKAQILRDDYTFPSGKMVEHETYCDVDFDFDDQLPYLSGSGGRVVWLRPHQFGGGGIFGGQAPKPDDVIKGRHIYPEDEALDKSLNHLVLVLCVLCKREDYLNQLFIFYNSTAGVVAMKFWAHGQEDVVVFDDFIPCDAHSSQPLFAFSDKGFCWVPFILKGLAKMHGSYHSLFGCGASCREFFRDLTGEVVVACDLAALGPPGSSLGEGRDGDKYSDVCSHSFFGVHDCKRLFHALSPKVGGGSALLVCGSDVGEEAVLALRERVLGARQALDNLQAVCFLPLQEEEELLEGGSSVCAFSDVLGKYSTLYVCLLQAERRWEAVTRVPGRWDAAAGTSGGGIDSCEWRSNVLYRLTVGAANPPQGKLVLSLSIADRRAAGAGLAPFYPNTALTVCADHPSLGMLAHSVSGHRRDVALEFEWEKGRRSYVVVPSCYDKALSEDFVMTCVLMSEETGQYATLSVERATSFPGFDHIYSGLEARWVRGESSFGRIFGVAPQSCAFNPCWLLRLRFTERPKKKLKLKICMILESSKTPQPANQLAPVDNPLIPESAIARRGRSSPFLSTGVYLLTADFLSRLRHFEGRLGSSDLQFGPEDPGLLGSFAFVYEPISCVYQEVRIRAEDFKEDALAQGGRVVRDVVTHDYLFDMVVMPSTYARDDEGSFRLTVMTSEAVEVLQVDPASIPPPREHFVEVFRTRFKQSSQPVGVPPDRQFLIDNIRSTCLLDSSLLEQKQSIFDNSKPDRLVLRKKARNIKKKFAGDMRAFADRFSEAGKEGCEGAGDGEGDAVRR